MTVTAQSELNIIKLAVELVRLTVCASIEFNRFTVFQADTALAGRGMESGEWSLSDPNLALHPPVGVNFILENI